MYWRDNSVARFLLFFRSIVCRSLSLHYDKNTLASHAVHALRKRHANFAQKDYNSILKTDSFAVYSISDSFSYTLSSVTFFQKANHTTDAVLLLNYILFTISVSGLFLKFRKFKPRYSYKIYAQKKERVYLSSAYFLSNIKPINLRNSGLRNCF